MSTFPLLLHSSFYVGIWPAFSSNFFKGCLPQFLLGPFLNTVSQVYPDFRGICFFAAFFGRKLIVIFPANIYLLKVSNRNTEKRCEKRSRLIIIYAVLALLYFTLNIFHTFF